MIEFFYTKSLRGGYSRPGSFGRGEEHRLDWDLLDPLLDEVWGRPWRIGWVLGFLDAEMDPDIDTSSTGMNDVYLEKKNGFIVISFEWAGDKEFLFPEKKRGFK